MTVTVVGLLPKQEQHVAHHLPNIKFKFLRECQRRKVEGPTVIVTNFIGHADSRRARSDCKELVYHRGGTSTLVERIRQMTS